MTVPDYAVIENEFDRHVRKHFAFLETEYGYIAKPTRTHYLGDPRDASVSIRYFTETISIQIGMSLAGFGAGVTFKNESWLNAPKDQRIKWVSLESVIAFFTNGKGKSLLQEVTSSRNKFWPQGFLHENLESIIEVLATQVKMYALDIVRGDHSQFTAIAVFNKRSAT